MPTFNEALSKQVVALREAEALPVIKFAVRVNDAVMVPRDKRSCDLCRVEAVTTDGRACVCFLGEQASYSGDYRIEDEPGQWPVVGRFVWRGWFCGGWVLEHVSDKGEV